MNFETFWDILFPSECLACGKSLAAGTLCATCRKTIGGPRAITIKTMDIDGRGDCYFLGAAGRYKNHVLKTLIHALKFGGITGAARPLAEILAHHAQTIALPIEAFVVMPVPLSKIRLHERGFNQSVLIAEHFARLLNLPFEKNIMARTHHRKPQSGTTTLAERHKNIRGCFATRSTIGPTNKNIILVDDVSMSGSTFREATRALTAAGAETILALARA